MNLEELFIEKYQSLEKEKDNLGKAYLLVLDENKQLKEALKQIAKYFRVRKSCRDEDVRIIDLKSSIWENLDKEDFDFLLNTLGLKEEEEE